VTSAGPAVFIVDTRAPGVKAQALNTIAYDKRSDVTLKDVAVGGGDLLGQEGQGWEIVSDIICWGSCLLAAYATGAAQRSLDMSVEYAKQRWQFGGQIANFQVIQHRFAEMLVAVEGSRLLTYEAAWRLAQGLPADMEVAAAKSWAGETFNRVASNAMRVYAGMGSTKECDIQLYYRRIKVVDMFLGDHDAQKQRIMALMRPRKQ
jgi:alkylation response protein AidB-like acyl-CoA dehydrogenase